MTSNPTVSVIIPVYNSERFLAEAIQSVLNQTLPPDEIIVVDDGSTDGSAAIVAGLAGTSPLPIRYVYQENQGPAAARNHGIQMAHGDFLAFLDADDVWLPEKNKCQMQVLNAHPLAGVAWGCAITFAGDIAPGEAPSSVIVPLSPRFLLQSMLFRRAALEQVGGFDETMRLGEDVDWLFRAMESSLLIVVHGDLVVYYRRHENNSTSDEDQTNRSMIGILKKSLARRRVQGNLMVNRLASLLILPSVKGIRYNQLPEKA
ncbi:MAG: glycosyltransferase family 2 protein [Caldilineaceae bacterium]|nr:glycosyltransferase family 2 protein [Caldilineaceae bacterium]